MALTGHPLAGALAGPYKRIARPCWAAEARSRAAGAPPKRKHPYPMAACGVCALPRSSPAGWAYGVLRGQYTPPGRATTSYPPLTRRAHKKSFFSNAAPSGWAICQIYSGYRRSCAYSIIKCGSVPGFLSRPGPGPRLMFLSVGLEYVYGPRAQKVTSCGRGFKTASPPPLPAADRAGLRVPAPLPHRSCPARS